MRAVAAEAREPDVSDNFPTREEAETDALRQALEADGEGFTITSCVCSRQDLHDMADDLRTSIMAECTRCERKFIPAAGNA